MTRPLAAVWLALLVGCAGTPQGEPTSLRPVESAEAIDTARTAVEAAHATVGAVDASSLTATEREQYGLATELIGRARAALRDGRADAATTLAAKARALAEGIGGAASDG